MLFYVITILVIIADQAAKWGVRSNMQLGETVQVWSGHTQFTYYENSGAAFSSFQGYGKYFAIIAVLFFACIFCYRRKVELRFPILAAASAFFVGVAFA
ncbi:signal peptidase II, partial [Paenibacillus riograndensis]